MGACKACNEIFGVTQLKNSLCEKCIEEGHVNVKAIPTQPIKKEQPVKIQELVSKLVPCVTCGKEISKTAKQCPHCGEEYVTKKDIKEKNKLAKEYANSGSKSRFISFILTGLFGNLGLFYAGVKAGIGLLIVNAIIILSVLSSTKETKIESATLILIFLFTWYILPILWGNSIVVKQKKKLQAEAKLMTSK